MKKKKESQDISRIARPRELTKREREIVKLIAEGFKNREIGEKLGISTKTVETHRANIINKMAFRNVAHLIRYAIQKRIVTVDIE